MPRHRHMKAKKRIVVLSPIQELSGESRSPTPVNDAALANVCVSKKDDLSLVGRETSESEESVTTSLTVDAGDRFLDHLMTLNEENQDEIMKLRRQLYKEREMNAKLQQEARQYRLDFYNYRMSWDLDQAEIQTLKELVQSLEEGKKQKDLEERMKRLEEEHEKLKQSHSEIVKENLSLKNIISSMTSVNAERDQTGEKGEEAKVTVLPKVPRSPSKGSRRPYTGKSREVHLLPITENNKVVTSTKQTTGYRSRNQLSSPNSLPTIPATATPFLPTPPSCSRQTPSRRHSRMSLASGTVHAVSSVGNVSLGSQEQHGHQYGRNNNKKD